ncbi:type 2 isopentenyl-diphosphate Delta-isomerase [Heliobacterium mobile]|uniref:type 2 isopentenyl-diphosphate Delta-isomerase n=1 Tax=Heliobacterium mobile TaxID=28064 RepID=UPI0012D7BB2D|nr:type 2 isopentenyl-diphosphate Delta-isomerase [Heliobacterium mobile]
MDIRQQRKLDHIRQALSLEDGPIPNGFKDVRLIHEALPNLDSRDIDISVSFLGKTLTMPLLINAITGGTPQVTDINRRLARIAAKAGIGIAVGSQAAALRDPAMRESYQVVREENPDGIVIANVNPNTPVDQAIKAIEMIQADALQVHLNVAQEMAMAEGDRDFRHWPENLAELIRHCPVPVIAKEVGNGVSFETAERLMELGVRYIDVGGAGGTNFIAIEMRRRGLELQEFEAWGISSAVTLAEVAWSASDCLRSDEKLTIIASGGIRNGWEAAKSFALGAKVAAVAGSVLKHLLSSSDGEQSVVKYIEEFRQELIVSFTLTNSSNLDTFAQQPCLILGEVKEWLEQRGIPIAFWSQRNRKNPVSR